MSEVTPDMIVEETLKWVTNPRVPYRHQGRSKVTGVDCIGLPIMIGRKFGIMDYDSFWYAAEPDGETMEAEADKTLGPLLPAPVPGSVGLFWMIRKDYPQHMGIFVPYVHGGLAIVHAHSKLLGVTMQRYDAITQRRLVKTYGFPKVSYG